MRNPFRGDRSGRRARELGCRDGVSGVLVGPAFGGIVGLDEEAVIDPVELMAIRADDEILDDLALALTPAPAFGLATGEAFGSVSCLGSDPRYADDLRVFVRSERAAQRVFERVCGVIERRLKLKVNREKSSIRHAAQATLLGFGFFFDGPRAGIRIAPKAITRLKDQLRRLTKRSWSVSMAHRIGKLNRLITGWMAYFRLAQRVSVLAKLDGWLRRRLRQVRWKEWKTTAAKRHNLRLRGISESEVRKWAGVTRRYWKVAGSQILQVSLPNSYWDHLGLKTLTRTWQRLSQTA
jgi:hypothetical protein